VWDVSLLGVVGAYAGSIRSGRSCNRASCQSRKSRSLRLRDGWRSLRIALASIWRTRSRVTPNRLPTSSRVRC